MLPSGRSFGITHILDISILVYFFLLFLVLFFSYWLYYLFICYWAKISGVQCFNCKTHVRSKNSGIAAWGILLEGLYKSNQKQKQKEKKENQRQNAPENKIRNPRCVRAELPTSSHYPVVGADKYLASLDQNVTGLSRLYFAYKRE